MKLIIQIYLKFRVDPILIHCTNKEMDKSISFRRRPLPTQPSSSSPLPLQRGQSTNRLITATTTVPAPFTCLSTLFLISPVAVIFLLIFIIVCTFTAPTSKLQIQTTKIQPSLKTTLTLHELASTVADALDDNSVTFWLMPNTGLLPPISQRATGSLAPWREGLDFGVNQTHLMKILIAQSYLQREFGIVAVESYFGIRLFQMSGYRDDRYDFNTPFIDLVYFQTRLNSSVQHVVNYCCDCTGVVVGVCTKKTCGCLVCAIPLVDLLPLSYIYIDNIDMQLPILKSQAGIVIPNNIPNIHPAIFSIT